LDLVIVLYYHRHLGFLEVHKVHESLLYLIDLVLFYISFPPLHNGHPDIILHAALLANLPFPFLLLPGFLELLDRLQAPRADT